MRTQDVAIQVWAESDFHRVGGRTVTDRYCVPTFIGRGYSSRGYLWSAAADAVAACRAGKEVHILHVGDYDPSGEDIYRDVEETLRLYAVAHIRGPSVATCRWAVPNIDIATLWMEFERLALTPEQIAEHDLPMRPAKPKDVRTARFTGTGTVEVEALPVDALLEIVEDAIEDRIDADALEVAKLAERSERDIARRIAGTSVDKLLAAAS